MSMVLLGTVFVLFLIHYKCFLVFNLREIDFGVNCRLAIILLKYMQTVLARSFRLWIDNMHSQSYHTITNFEHLLRHAVFR